MSKGDGQKIAIKFSEKLIGDVTGLFPTPSFVGKTYYRPIGTASGSSQSSSTYSFSKAFDGLTSSYWRTNFTTNQWIQILLSEPVFIGGFRWYVGSGNRPKDFNIQGSNDGISWTVLHIGVSPNITGWHEFKWTPNGGYKYYRWTGINSYGPYIYIYEIELLGAGGNEVSFEVAGYEYQYVGGPMISKNYKVVSVEQHPSILDEKTLLLTLDPQSRFNNSEGSITVAYDASAGNLQGRGGFVASFSQTFIPIELAPKPNPHASEHLTVSAETNINFLKVDYNRAYADETLTVSATAAVDFIHVNDINP